MGLFDMTDGILRPVKSTTFAAEKVLERQHLQAAIRDNIGLIGADLLVVSEEFGEFAEANRRIDLLCVDRQARLVVVELKRTEDGGHMELQALRYAAMVSAMTFDELVTIYGRHLTKLASDDSDDARDKLIEFLDDTDDAEPVISRQVGIVLVASGFDRQITTAALWLNDVYGLDIRCVKLTPYRVEGRLLLDVQPVIPLPEAEEFVIKLKRRETAVRAAKSGQNRDFTKYTVTVNGETSEPLRKRRAVLAMVQAVHAAGVQPADMSPHLGIKFLAIDGSLDGPDLVEAFVSRYPNAKENVGRWFFDAAVHDGARTWVLSKMWGLNTEAALANLVALAPGAGITFAAV